MKLLRDTWLVFGRYFWIFIHNPAWVVIGVVQPLLYLLLFAPLLKKIQSAPGFPRGGAYNVFVPGLLVQLGLFGAAGVGFSLIAELRMGVVERLLTASVAYAVALWTRSENSYAPIIFTATLPILLLSGVLLPLSFAPQWLRNIAAANPLSYAVDAARAVFLAHLSDPSVIKGVAIMAVLCLISILIGARAFGRAVA
ncbi:MAG: hypothetical protein AUJ02_03575 [Chloroflexi bacterium 13_1_40CM_3_65_12]|nr:MAG: hypothetical protein AUH40_02200 [Chloroflexi bacterium 13_1_40CM_65_17]OLD25956.1 MAG: hypothetical protein AUJ02_03575 [Chloroflexi bacterium 13_1_40CM_3_65_12]OLD50810.1 MAG: hypothetical protein AUI42_01500 [Actinobacteria bacterium 13_1_40CM_2_65_8]